MKYLSIFNFSKSVLFFVLSILLLLSPNLKAQVIELSRPSVYNGFYIHDTIQNDSLLINAIVPSYDNTAVPFNEITDNASGSMISTASTTGSLHPHIPNTYSINTSMHIGEIPINSSISPSGALVYEVPIDFFSANNVVGNLKPSVSLVYNSQSGNGDAGFGWSISGLSAITLNNASFYYDGHANAKQLTLHDIYYLDGGRLIRTGQQSNVSFEYISEQGNIKVKAFMGSNGSFARYFTVYYPNGHIGTFGYENNSTAQTVYPLTELKDSYGNSLVYTYTFINNHYRISEIKNPKTGLSVNFSYTTRTDVYYNYDCGKKITKNYLLHYVSTINGSSTMATYLLGHKQQINTGLSLLSEIYCISTAGICNPLCFFYGINGVITNFEKSNVTVPSYFNLDKKDLLVVKGKFDWGTDDDAIIVYPNKNPYVHYSRPGGLLNHSENYYINQYNADQDIIVYQNLQTNPFHSVKLKCGTGFITMLAGDIDGRSGDEIIKVNNTVVNNADQITFTTYKANLSTPLVQYSTAVFTSSTFITDASGNKSVLPKTYFAGNFIGDGKCQVFAVSYDKPMSQAIPSRCYLFDVNAKTKLIETSSILSFKTGDILFPFDYDGDGKTDICHIHTGGTDVYSFKKATTTSYALQKVRTYTGIKLNDLIGEKKLLLGDINGDGKTDILLSPGESYTFKWQECIQEDWSSGECLRWEDREEYRNMGNTWKAYMSKGDGDFEVLSYPIILQEQGTEFILQDVNGDGASDFVFKNNSGQIRVHLASLGKIKSTAEAGSTFVNSNALMIPSNVALSQYHSHIIALDKSTFSKLRFTRNDFEQHLLTGMVNSYGIVTKTNHRRLNDRSSMLYVFYQQAYNANFPYDNYQGPIFAVQKTETYWNNTLKASKEYAYTNAVVHKQGLGFRGFETVTTMDKMKNHTFTQTYNPLNYSTLVKDDSPFSQTTYEYTVSAAANKKLSISLKKKTSKDKLNNSTVTSSYIYDSYNFPTQETTDFGGIQTATTKITYRHVNNDASYILGLPLTTTITQTQGASTWSTKSEVTYNVNHKPESVKNYTQNNLTDETHYTYTTHGNLLEESCKLFSSTDWHTTSYEYSTDGKFLTKEINPMGQATTYNYDTKTCFLTDVTDFKGNKTEFTQSVELLRPSTYYKTTYPDGTEKCDSLYWNAEGDKLWALSSRHTGSPTQITYYDAFNRDVQSSVVSFNGQYINLEKEYDNYGRLLRKAQQHFGSNPTKWINFEYDNYDRLTKETHPSGRVVSYTYGANTVTTNDAGLTNTAVYNTLGQLLTVTDPAETITYTYRPDGQPASIKTPDNSLTTFTYDNYGRQTQITDPSAGTQSYTYDNAGNIKTQTNANNKTITTTYNKFGLPVKITRPEFTSTYTYTTDYRLSSVTGNNGTSKSFVYDKLGRLTKETEKVDNVELVTGFTYDKGRIASAKYNVAGNDSLVYVYNTYGYLSEIKLKTVSVWKANTRNALGQLEKATLGNGTVMTKTYSTDGFIQNIQTVKGSTVLQNYTYAFDAQKCLLTSRKDEVNNKTENFGYDNLLRLKSYGMSGSVSTVAYSTMGNITSKTDAGTMTYNVAGKPYAIGELTGNPGSVPSHLQNIAYTSFGRPRALVENNYRADFIYNDAYQRAKMTVTRNDAVEYTRYYLGGNYEKEVSGNGTVKSEFLYLGGSPYSAPAVYSKEGGTWKLYYLHRDHLGSITQVSDANGIKVAEYSYDAWGRTRNPANQTPYTPTTQPALKFNRGFTGHEHLPEFGLINMNARLYDPVLGRFLSPDPYVQSPDYSQNFNRYSYAVNNPLLYADESGEFLHIVIPAVVGGIINVASNWKNINNFSDGLKAFGIGAAAGAIAGATGGAAFAALGGGAAGVGGFLAGAGSGMVASAYGIHVQSMGNAALFGNDFPSLLEYSIAIATGGLIGGAVNGTSALINNRNFWNGTINKEAMPSPVLRTEPIKGGTHSTGEHLNNHGIKNQNVRGAISFKEDIVYQLNLTHKQRLDINMSEMKFFPAFRPEISGYKITLGSQKDLYHSFPQELDALIIKNGYISVNKNGSYMMVSPGSIIENTSNGVIIHNGYYTIGIHPNGIIYHRNFYNNNGFLRSFK